MVFLFLNYLQLMFNKQEIFAFFLVKNFNIICNEKTLLFGLKKRSFFLGSALNQRSWLTGNLVTKRPIDNVPANFVGNLWVTGLLKY